MNQKIRLKLVYRSIYMNNYYHSLNNDDIDVNGVDLIDKQSLILKKEALT